MKYRDYYFKREATIANTDTIIIPIDIKDPISYIDIEYEATNGATSCESHELHDDITSIELVDGSQVLWSLKMNQARALNFFETGFLPHEKCNEGAAGTQEEKCTLHFGRHPDDPEYYLKPSSFKNLQLRLTHSLTISATVGFATGTGKVTVMARIIEEGATVYKGYMTAKQKKSFTSVTSGDEETILPTDMPYRLMLLEAVKTLYRHDEILTKHKLTIDADKYIPFENYTEDIDDMNRIRFGLARQFKETFSKDTSVFLSDIYNVIDAVARIESTADAAFVANIDAEQITVFVVDFSTIGTPAAQTTEDRIYCTLYGTQPYGCLAIPFGDLSREEDWLKAQQYDDIRLYSTMAVAGACTVILQQLAK